MSAVKPYVGSDLSLGLSEMEKCLPRDFKQSELIRFIFLWFQTGLQQSPAVFDLNFSQIARQIARSGLLSECWRPACYF